jgi:hypothetical protein
MVLNILMVGMFGLLVTVVERMAMIMRFINACIGQSYVTSGPENTEEIIECIIKNIRRKNNE